MTDRQKQENKSLRSERWILLVILACAFGLRVAYLSSGVPYAVGIDEPVIVERALRILQTGDWNPHGFDYPTLAIYLQVGVTWALHMLLAPLSPVSALDVGAVYAAGRLMAALLGTVTVWLTYRLGLALDSRALGLVAAAQLAAYPMHVRESHYVLTDVPTTALITLTLWLALRAGRHRTPSAYGWAGCAAGLSAAAKYNGAVVALAIGIVWLVYERSASDRVRKMLAAGGAGIFAFVMTVPYAILDHQTFLSGLTAQLVRVDPRVVDPPWRTYLIHLSLAWRFWLPLAAVGAAIVGWKRESLKDWSVPLGFVAAYYVVLAMHPVVFGRYALPLLPGLCLLAAVPVIALIRATEQHLGRRWVAPGLVGGGLLLMSATFASDSIAWLDQFRRPDTRMIAARWMISALPPGARIAVSATGPTYLDHAGFAVVARPNQIRDLPLDAYVENRVEYVVTAPQSAGALASCHTLCADGVVFGIDPSADRWGPYVRVVRLRQAD